MRWALSAGRLEYRGYPARAISVVGGAARGRGASVRSCTGAWEHGAEAWIDLSPGAIAWMFDFPSASAVDSALEREACAVEAPR
ncbi:MAG: hypothetical protein H7124_10425, partial [Phycisphaerales bacterium]|nr:hypothetical protein [Hyphomonadaceae bacterium]